MAVVGYRGTFGIVEKSFAGKWGFHLCVCHMPISLAEPLLRSETVKCGSEKPFSQFIRTRIIYPESF